MSKITRTRMMAFFEAMKYLHYNKDWNAEITYDTRSLKPSDKVELKVSWWACGAQTPDEAREFFYQVQRCTHIAKYLNAYGFYVDWEGIDEYSNTNREEYEALVEEFAKQIELENSPRIKKMLYGCK